jgi:multidrug transporter EmrE-like cation transporter
MRSLTAPALYLIGLAALLQAAANLLLRHGLARAGSFDIVAAGKLASIQRLAMQPTFVVGFVLFGAAAIIWFKVLSLAEVSASYPILVGLTFALVSVGAVGLFQESMSVLKGLGIGVILAGIVLVAWA